jgi:hypothetical protein
MRLGPTGISAPLPRRKVTLPHTMSRTGLLVLRLSCPYDRNPCHCSRLKDLGRIWTIASSAQTPVEVLQG